MKIKYLAAVLIGLAGLSLTQWADAAPLEMTYNDGMNMSSPNLFGTVIPGTQSGGQVDRDVLMTNQLVGMTTGQQGTFVVNGTTSLYSRSFNDFGSPPPTAVPGGAVFATGIQNGSTPVNVSLGTGFTYLVVAYDGPQGSVAIFNVAGLTGSVDLFRYAKIEIVNGVATGNLIGSNVAAQDFKLMTGWTLLNPTGSVPDGGTTVMLLGAALGGLGVARRFLKI
jgi:hypothetical protein